MYCATNIAIGWFIGDRSIKTFEKFYKEKLSHLKAVFYVDDWIAYKKVLSAGKCVVGKKYTISIEQNNSNIIFNCRTKVVSHSTEMIDLSLRLDWYLNEYGGFERIRKNIISIFT